MCKSVDFIIKNIQTIITIISIISMATFWIYTMNGIPADLERIKGEMKINFELMSKRVDTIDDRVRLAEQNLEKNNTKTDLTLQAVYEIRGLLLKR